MSKQPPIGSVPKLQRPLHRQRGRPRTSPPIRDTEELKQLFECSKAELPARLAAFGVAYHRDSAGHYWAALEQKPDAPATEGQEGKEGKEGKGSE